MDGDQVKLRAVIACILFAPMVDGKGVKTVESLGGRHPVQSAMVEQHASQCGFCSPGFVMSLYGLYLQEPQPTVPQIETALQGNLCRCTGYAPIVKAGLAMHEYADPESDPLVAGRDALKARVKAINDSGTVEIGEGKQRLIVPGSVDELARIYAANPDATIVNGATDVGLWVTKFMRDIGPLISIVCKTVLSSARRSVRRWLAANASSGASRRLKGRVTQAMVVPSEATAMRFVAVVRPPDAIAKEVCGIRPAVRARAELTMSHSFTAPSFAAENSLELSSLNATATTPPE